MSFLLSWCVLHFFFKFFYLTLSILSKNCSCKWKINKLINGDKIFTLTDLKFFFFFIGISPPKEATYFYELKWKQRYFLVVMLKLELQQQKLLLQLQQLNELPLLLLNVPFLIYRWSPSMAVHSDGNGSTFLWSVPFPSNLWKDIKNRIKI